MGDSGYNSGLGTPKSYSYLRKVQQPNQKGDASRRILVVDDDPLVALTFQALLSEDGHKVETAESAEDALAKFCAGSYDLVITDQGLPRMTGMELARALREKVPAQRIILTSGSPQAQFKDQSPCPNVYLLGKPFIPEELKAAVAHTFTAG